MTGLGASEELVRRIAHERPRVVVVGDAILDAWLAGECHRFAREGPAPVLDVSSHQYAPGGAANTAVNLAALGARVRLVAVTGDDADGATLRTELGKSGVDTQSLVAVPGRATMTKRRVVADTQLLVRVDDGDSGALPEPLACGLRREVTRAVSSADAVLVCDYGLGLLDDAMIDTLRAVRPEMPVCAVDAHELGRFAVLRPDFVTPNLQEVRGLLDTELGPDPVATITSAAPSLRRRTGARSVIVTMDRNGTVLLDDEADGADGAAAHRTWADPVPERQTAGAGDTFLAATCLARALGEAMTTAVELGQAAADVVVHDGGTSVVHERAAGRPVRPVPGRGAVRTGLPRPHRVPARGRSADRVHQRLLRPAAPRPRRLPEPGQTTRRRTRRRDQLR